MKYYKLIKDGQFIGIASSDNFIKFNPVSDCFLHSNEVEGEFISCDGSFYRDSWMRPINMPLAYEEVQVIEIDENAFFTYANAIQQNEEIVEEPEEEIEPAAPIPSPQNVIATLEFMRASKIAEMNSTCRRTIEDGFDLEIRGETRHFSLSTQDQLNLMGLSAIVQTQALIPYHADGEAYEFYTAQEINEILAAATALKNYNTAYYNSLKTYINTLENVEEITAITYGTPIPEEYKSDVLKVLEY